MAHFLKKKNNKEIKRGRERPNYEKTHRRKGLTWAPIGSCDCSNSNSDHNDDNINKDQFEPRASSSIILSITVTWKRHERRQRNKGR